jgi:hypothetical protein
VEHRTDLQFDDFARTMLQLPVRHGGVGFCPSSETAPHAFVAGMAAATAGFLGNSNLVRSGKWETFKQIPSMQCLEKIIHELNDAPFNFDGKRHMETSLAFQTLLLPQTFR